ncbi:MAG: 5'-nucleotidase C-terminal domain-containing protein, partial [Thiobacillus sp.]|nr:5'-nucleotidase C-terminal domain-containing protein [Thiobacillus sp.]
DVADNLFNDDPYYQQGGDMVRVGGIEYTINPTKKMGQRISDMTMKGKPVEAGKTYVVAGWAPVAEGATGEPVWDVVASYLRDVKVVKGVKLNTPKIVGVGKANPGIAGYDGSYS